MDRPLRILITNITLAGRSGTEIVTRDLARGLLARGLSPSIYSPRLGAIADELRADGLTVVSDLSTLPVAPDVVHGHHHVPTVQALVRFPAAAGIFVCHDGLAASDVPPRLPNLLRYVAVDQNCRERLIECDVPEDRIDVVYNAVDLDRFASRGSLPPRPQRAAVFSHYAAGAGTHLPAVQAACTELGLPLDVIGEGVERSEAAPERVLGVYDVVFAKARCALEAMAVGAAVVLCDTRGLGTLVTSADVEGPRSWNFGMRLLRRPLSPAAIAAEVRRYDAVDAAAVSRWVREHCSLGAAVARYIEIYRQVRALPVPPREPADVPRDYMDALLTRIGRLEGELRATREGRLMEPLSAAVASRVRVSVVEIPSRVQIGAPITAVVAIENGTDERLASFTPCPVQLSYRWLTLEGAPLASDEGVRTPLPEPLGSGQKVDCAMRVIAPSVPGVYTLRLTLVQERVRWFDGLTPPVCADVLVAVE